MSNDWDSFQPSFDDHLRRRNAARLRFASWYFAAVMLALIVAELIVPVLHSWRMTAVQAVSGLYFCTLAWLCRGPYPARWPTQALPLLFGAGAALTGLLFTVILGSRFGATPPYATIVFVVCLAPLWKRAALVATLVPAHALYLWSIFGVHHDITYRTVMTMGGTAALPLGGIAAILAYRGERQAYDDMAAIRALLVERREMVAMVAHDLQSPLSGIRALLRTMTGRSAQETRGLVEIARTCGEMHGAVTRLVLAHQDSAEGDRAAVALDAVLREATAKAMPMAAEKRITVVAEADPLWVNTEPSLLGAIIDNLVSNAIKFCPAGSVVRLTTEPREAAVRVSVVDNGPGVAAGDIPLLFRKFSRLRTRPTGGEPSTGLGLYIVRTLAERMGARAGFAHNPGGGSVFFVDLPRA